MSGSDGTAWQRTSLTPGVEGDLKLRASVGVSGSLPIIEGYALAGYDEALLPDGRPRPVHATVLESLCAMGPAELREREALLEREKVAASVVFRCTGDEAASAFPVDLVPRVLTSEEWRPLRDGAAQRARALDAFLNDIYGEAAILRDGILPRGLVSGSPGHRAEGAAPPPNVRRAQVCGIDIVRDGEERWFVLEDNVRWPSGVAYAIQNRRLLRRVFPELTASVDLLDPEQAPALLRQALHESAPLKAAADPASIVLLSDGPADSAYFEHHLLAEEMGVPLVVPADLLVADDVVWHVCASGQRRVDVIYLRIDDQLLQRVAGNGLPLAPQLVQAVRAGTLTLANALGSGVADDKAIYAYMPKFIEYYLGEQPRIEQVPTYHCADPEQRTQVLARLDQLVVKPLDGYGGLGVVIGPLASEEELARARLLIVEQPDRWIAQETVSLSTHPTYEDGKLRPRHIDLRMFVYYGASPVVVPAALTRVAPSGSLVVNSSRGGGAKDTWLLR